MDASNLNFAFAQTRRQFFGRAATGIGAAALASLLDRYLVAAVAQAGTPKNATHGILKALHHAPKAKRVIYLHQSGAPSHIDLFDYKPKMQEFSGQELPASIRMGQRITGMTSGQAKFPVAASKFKFAQMGRAASG